MGALTVSLVSPPQTEGHSGAAGLKRDHGAEEARLPRGAATIEPGTAGGAGTLGRGPRDPPVANLVTVRLRVGAWGNPGRTSAAPVLDTDPRVPRCSRARARALLLRHLPVLAWLPQYPVRDWLLGDLLSGLSVAIMQLPQGESPLTQRLCPQPLGSDPGLEIFSLKRTLKP